MTNSSKIILVDQDGPLADWEHTFLQRWREAYPELPWVEYEDRKSFYAADDLADLVPVQEQEEIRSKARQIYCAPGFCRNLPVVPGCRDALLEIRDLGFEIAICTSPLSNYQNCVLEKYQWVEQNLGSDFTNHIVMCRNKALVRGDYLIDDRPDASERDGISPLWKQIIFDAPYNKHLTGMPRLRHWQEWRRVLTL